MAKLKRAGKKKPADQTTANLARALPCLFFIVGGIILMSVLFYYSLASSTK